MTIGQPTDRELGDRAAGGDAFAGLFDRHSRAVHNHCFRLTASWAAAEDLTSTVFLLAWRKRARVRPESPSALPYLLGMATNACRAGRRTLARRVGRTTVTS